jgi:hypothetical protein
MKRKAFSTILTFLIVLTTGNACTTFLISGKYTTDGKPILFKNRDTDQMQNALAYFEDGTYKYIALVDGNEEWDDMVWGGYNETGFAIINSVAYNINIGDTSRIVDREGYIMKLALQTCSSLQDFENLLNALPKPMGSDANFGVIDANGGAAYYETGNYDFVKYDANDPKVAPNGILVRTNYSFRSDLTKGYGFCRYNTALAALNNAFLEKRFEPQYLLDHISRNLYHSLTKTNLTDIIPENKEVRDYRFFIDFIPREATASAILIHGAKDPDHSKDAMMWSIIGFPLTSIALPVWITGGKTLPKAVSLNTDLKSPLCCAALKFKKLCFPITIDKGTNYINLSAVINKENTGYLQMLKPIENEIFKNADILSEGLENGSKSQKDIQNFYTWADTYIARQYEKLFHIDLFHER